MWEGFFETYLLFLMVFARMAGMLLFNPILGKRHVPAQIKMGLALLCAFILTPAFDSVPYIPAAPVPLVLGFLKELLIGFGCGFVISLFLAAALMAGEMIDMQLGMSMSRIYDPQSNVSMPLTGTVYNLMFGLMFFAADGHLALIRLIADSFALIPPGPVLPNLTSGPALSSLFGDMLSMAVRMALPVIAMELFCELGLGILMRTVPQINIFAAGLQLKLLAGLVMVVAMLSGTAGALGTGMDNLFGSIQNLMRSMA
jgi:flagellar biosynthetic protein FliR